MEAIRIFMDELSKLGWNGQSSGASMSPAPRPPAAGVAPMPTRTAPPPMAVPPSATPPMGMTNVPPPMASAPRPVKPVSTGVRNP